MGREEDVQALRDKIGQLFVNHVRPISEILSQKESGSIQQLAKTTGLQNQVLDFLAANFNHIWDTLEKDFIDTEKVAIVAPRNRTPNAPENLRIVVPLNNISNNNAPISNVTKRNFLKKQPTQENYMKDPLRPLLTEEMMNVWFEKESPMISPKPVRKRARENNNRQNTRRALFTSSSGIGKKTRKATRRG